MLNVNLKKEQKFINEVFAAARYIPEEGLIEEDLEDFIGALPIWFDSSWNYGFSKLVLTPANKNYVIKIPLSIGEDFCKIELERYEGIKYLFPQYVDMFAEIKKLPESPCKGFDIYLQEKVVVFADFNKFQLYHYDRIIEKMLKNTISKTLSNNDVPLSNSIAWWMNVLSGYFQSDIYKLNDFIEFLHRQELDKDLHCKNIGYYPDTDLPVIFDYSGYGDQYSY